MKMKKTSYESGYAVKNGLKIKTVSFEVTVTHPNLRTAVREAFELAKGAGRELNLDFTCQASAKGTLNPLQIGKANAGSGACREISRF